MENTERDTAQNAYPQNDWHNAETNDENKDFSDVDAPRYVEEESFDERVNFSASLDDPDPKEEDDEEEDEEEGDWGHVDPAEGNGPFPDSNDPSGPGSAV